LIFFAVFAVVSLPPHYFQRSLRGYMCTMRASSAVCGGGRGDSLAAPTRHDTTRPLASAIRRQSSVDRHQRLTVAPARAPAKHINT